MCIYTILNWYSQELLARKIPYSGMSDSALSSAIASGQLPKKPTSVGQVNFERLWSICCRCWENPKDRPTMREVVFTLVSNTNGCVLFANVLLRDFV